MPRRYLSVSEGMVPSAFKVRTADDLSVRRLWMALKACPDASAIVEMRLVASSVFHDCHAEIASRTMTHTAMTAMTDFKSVVTLTRSSMSAPKFPDYMT